MQEHWGLGVNVPLPTLAFPLEELLWVSNRLDCGFIFGELTKDVRMYSFGLRASHIQHGKHCAGQALFNLPFIWTIADFSLCTVTIGDLRLFPWTARSRRHLDDCLI